MKFRLVLALATVAVFGFAGAAHAQDKVLIEKGAKLYVDQKCSLCHAIDGKGNAKGALDGVGTKLTAAELTQWLVDPKGMTTKTKATRMPAMKTYPNLQKAEVEALVAYLGSLKKK